MYPMPEDATVNFACYGPSIDWFLRVQCKLIACSIERNSQRIWSYKKVVQAADNAEAMRRLAEPNDG